MIITQKNGRRKSEFTLGEAEATTRSMIKTLSEDERELFVALLAEGAEGSIEIENEILNHCYHTKPVSMEHFITDPYYLGDSCTSLYPQIKQDLIELFDRPYRECVMCLHPDTLVPLMNGTDMKMSELIKKWDDTKEPVWIYSVKKDGEIVPSQAVDIRYTGEDDYYSVKLDDGSTFVCNARHRMVMRDGNKKMVKDMSIGDSIMPFITEKSKKSSKRRIEGYELILDLKTENYVYTHAISAAYKYGEINSKEKTIHHVDFNKLNNEPDNLNPMIWKEHQLLHSKSVREMWAANPDYRKRLSAGSRERVKDPNSPVRKAQLEYMMSPAGRKLSISNLDKANVTYEDRVNRFKKATDVRWNGKDSDKQRREAAERMRDRNLNGNAREAARLSFSNRSEEAKQAHRDRLKYRNQNDPQARLDITYEKICEVVDNGAVTISAAAKALECSAQRIRTVFKKEGVELKEKFPKSRNHFVVSIEKIGYGPVCCMTVPDTENFAIITNRDDGKREGVFSSNTGGIGVGKTMGASVAICRILYELSCLISPQKTFGMSAGSEMVIPLISKNLTLSREVMKTAVDDKIRMSPYFMTHFTPKISKDYSIFPHNIRVTIGSYGSDRILGTNIFTAFLDETNFPPKRKGQQIQTGFGVKKDIAHFDIVEKMYRTILRRIKSRFQKAGGRFPGMLLLCSSAATVESFVERKLKKSKDDPDVFVRDHTQWTAKPKDNFCGEMFYVLCSHSSMMARILKQEEYEIITPEYLDTNDAWIMDIPIEFKEDFETDLEEALRDIGGISTQALSIYIQRPHKIIEAVDEDREHPFTKYEWVSGSPGKFIWDIMVRQYERRLPGGFVEKDFAPIRNPEAMRWCHIDVSISGDCTGFCVGHIERWVEVVRRGEDGARYTDVAPYYVIDVMMRIVPPPGEQIYMPDLRQLIYQMMKKGYKFLGYSSDTFQYVEMHQQLKRKGVTPHILSMDTSTAPYDELKSAFYEDRIEIYDYEPFIDELKKLEYDRIKGKIDHTQGESKDVTDAVCGVVASLKKHANRMPMYTDKSHMMKKAEEHAWVSPLLEANSENIELVKRIGDGGAHQIMPIMFGDDF